MTRIKRLADRHRNDSGLRYSRDIDHGDQAVPVPDGVQLIPLGRRHQNQKEVRAA